MKNIILLSLLVIMCMLFISGCIYSSANMMRIRSDNVTVLGPNGYIHAGANTAITLYTGRQVASKDAIKDTGKIDWPTVPTLQEDSNANLNIGKPSKNLPTGKVVVPETTPGVASALIGR